MSLAPRSVLNATLLGFFAAVIDLVINLVRTGRNADVAVLRMRDGHALRGLEDRTFDLRTTSRQREDRGGLRLGRRQDVPRAFVRPGRELEVVRLGAKAGLLLLLQAVGQLAVADAEDSDIPLANVLTDFDLVNDAQFRAGFARVFRNLLQNLGGFRKSRGGGFRGLAHSGFL